VSWLGHYWAWTGGNIGALPLEALVTGVAGFVFRRKIKRAYERARDAALRPVHERLAAIHATASAAHRIAADTHRELTGLDHPDAPERQG
jgi:hypothetical protein